MSVTDNFAQLKEQVEKADRAVKAAAEQNQAEIKAKVDEARRDADERAAELRAKTDEAGREGESQWREMQADLKGHIERVRQRTDAKKAAVDADVAESDADWAEADAEDAIAFAIQRSSRPSTRRSTRCWHARTPRSLRRVPPRPPDYRDRRSRRARRLDVSRRGDDEDELDDNV